MGLMSGYPQPLVWFAGKPATRLSVAESDERVT